MATSKPRKQKQDSRRRAAKRFQEDVWIYFLLAIAIFAVYGQALQFDFVNYDDPDYVTANVHTRAGLTWDGVKWAFSSSFAGNWFPLTWLSHMLDCQLFGLDSGWHHFVNILIHTLSALFLFALLHRLTGSQMRSALVAFLFALHPLHVESVAWVAERKDVLSGFFWVMTLWAYVRYTARPHYFRYSLVLFAFLLGLMAKPMLVTLPLVLLLLDYWPLARGLHLVEKLPFFVLSIGVSFVTFVVHQQAGATASLELVPLATRFENALVSSCLYVVKLFWPRGLAVFYPYSQESLLLPGIAAGVGLLIVTLLALRVAHRWPFLTVGWLWYLVTLLPVIGIVQVGAQSRADRYTYLPMIGLTISLVWGASAALQPWPAARKALAVAACLICVVLTWRQVQYWRDGVSLFQHAVEVTSDNYVAHFNLASLLDSKGKPDEAILELREVVRIRPSFATAHAELGQLLGQHGRAEESLRELQIAVRLSPDDGDAHYRLGSVLGALGRPDQAISEFATVARLQPDNADAHYNLGISLALNERIEEAAGEFQATLRLRPNDGQARYNLGIAMLTMGHAEEAISQLSEAVRITPDSPEARQALQDAVRLKDGSRR